MLSFLVQLPQVFLFRMLMPRTWRPCLQRSIGLMLAIGATEHVFCVFGDSRVACSIDGHTPRDVLVITGFQDRDDWH